MGITLSKIVFASIVLLITFFVASCTNSGDSKSEDINTSTKATMQAFVKKVEGICESVDDSVILSIADISAAATTDPSGMAQSLKTSEDEMDRFISKLELVEPPKEYEEDWEAFLGENTEIRDTFPELSSILLEISGLTQKYFEDEDSQSQTASEFDELNDELELMIKGLKLRVNEIKIVTKNMDLDSCSDIVS